MGQLAAFGFEQPLCTFQFQVGVFFLSTILYTFDCYPFPAPNDKDATTTVLRDERKLDANGSGKYSYLVELSDGTKLEQEGDIVHNIKTVNGSLVVSGRYAFLDPDTGAKHEVEYTADETGYHPHVISPQQASKDNTKNETSAANKADENEKPLETLSASLFSSQSESF